MEDDDTKRDFILKLKNIDKAFFNLYDELYSIYPYFSEQEINKSCLFIRILEQIDLASIIVDDEIEKRTKEILIPKKKINLIKKEVLKWNKKLLQQ